MIEESLKAAEKRQRRIQIAVTFCAITALVVHKFDLLTVDSVSLVLLGIAMVPWLAPLVKSIKVPGVGEVEFNQLSSRVDDVGKSAAKAKEEIDQISTFVFKSLINKNEVRILEGLANETAFNIGLVDGSTENSLYQLRDSELISMGSVKSLRRQRIQNLQDYARITDHGRKYLELRTEIYSTRKRKFVKNNSDDPYFSSAG